MFNELWSINFPSQLILSYLSHLCLGLTSDTKFTKLTIFRDVKNLQNERFFVIVIFVKFVTEFNPGHISSLLIPLFLYFMIPWNEKSLKCLRLKYDVALAKDLNFSINTAH